MNLNDLKKQVDSYVAFGHGDDVVLITLSQPSVGGRACTGIRGIYSGIDWENGQIRIDPEKDVCLRGRAKDDVMDISIFAYSSPRPFYCCPICREHVKKDSNYCQCCGQHIKLNPMAEPRDNYKNKEN